MKYLKTTIVFTLIVKALSAQISTGNINIATLDINNVVVPISATGDLFYSGNANNLCEVPKGSGKRTVALGNLWIGGIDANGQIKMAAQTYRQNGSSFYGGPIMSAGSYSVALDNQWNNVWKINKTTIDSFKTGLYGASIPLSISNWPANGNITLGQAAVLAPYVDVNGDGFYSPVNGDYPCIRGDQALYFIYNDARVADSLSLGIEVRGMAYEYINANPSINNTVFINYQIINRSNIPLYNAYITSWTDFDIGYKS